MAALGARPARALPVDQPLAGFAREVWSPERGLPHPKVQAIAQTPDGYLWLGTDGGLVRFDGVAFTLFDWDATHALNLNSIRALRVDRAGALWIATGGNLLFRHDGARFEAMRERPDLRDFHVVALLESADGDLWLGGAGGLRRLHGRAPVDESARAGVAGVPVAALAETPAGTVWVATPGRLIAVSRDGVRAVGPGGGLPPGAITALAADAAGDLWIGADGGLARLSRGEWRRFGRADGLPDEHVTALATDRDGGLWIGTRAGLARPAPGGAFEALTRAQGLPDDDVRALFEDREGNLWVGTRAGGLVRLSQGRFAGVTSADGLPGDATTALAEDARGALWVGTAGAGVARLSGGAAATLSVARGLCVDTVWALAADRDGAVWVGGEGGAAGNLCRVGADGSVRTLGASAGVPAGAVRALLVAADGRLLVGASAIAHLPAGGERLVADATEHAPRAGAAWVYAFAQTAAGALWAATEDGPEVYEGERWMGLGRRGGLPVKLVLSFLPRATGELWLGTLHGLARWRDGRFAPFVAEQGLSGDAVFGVVEGGGALWLSLPRGIVRVRLDDVDAFERRAAPRIASTRFGAADGVRAGGGTGGRGGPTALRRRDGTLWFATERGVVHVDPARMPVNRLAPPVVIERVQVDGRAWSPRDAIVAPPGRRDLQVDYTAPSFVAPERVRFRYRLEGGGRDAWTDAGGRRTAYFTNLPPGRYRLTVVAANDDGVWNTAGAAVAFELAPAFHERAAFRALLAALIAAAALAAHRWRLRLAAARQAAVLAERARIARDVHDTLAQGFTGISLHLDAAARRLQSQPERARANLDEAQALVRTSLTEVRRAVADLRLSGLERGTVVSAVHDIARQLGAAVPVRVQVEGAPRPLARDREVALVRVVQEAVSNAVRHARARAVEVRLVFAPGVVRARVADDGEGFDPRAPPRGPGAGHFGLVGLRERAAALGGTLAIDSAAGRGTTITVGAAGVIGARIRVMVIDDHPVVRKGMVAVLDDEPDIEVVAEGDNGADAIRLYREHRPDVSLIDLVMPGLGGAETIAEIRREHPGARFVVLTTYAGDEDIHRAVEAGARGYLLKDTGCGEILDTIRAVHAGNRRIPPEIAQKLADRIPESDLSPREREVLVLIARGVSNRGVADALGITEGTVKTHVSNILIKLGVEDRTGAVTAALQRGIIRL